MGLAVMYHEQPDVVFQPVNVSVLEFGYVVQEVSPVLFEYGLVGGVFVFIYAHLHDGIDRRGGYLFRFIKIILVVLAKVR